MSIFMARISFVLILAAWMSGCGVRVPQINEDWEPADVNDELAYRIKKSIYCELTTAVRKYGARPYRLRGKAAQKLPNNWGAQVTLTLTADETGSLNPSGSYNRNIHPARDVLAPGGSVAQSLILPFTAQLSSQAVRIDTYYSFYTVPSMLNMRQPDTSCGEYNIDTDNVDPLNRTGSSFLLTGHVGIEDWMKGALTALVDLPSSNLPKAKSTSIEVLQYNIKFVVMTTGTANPMWRLAPVSTGIGGSPLVSANRTRTHQMLLTLGPVTEDKGSVVPASEAVFLHNNGQFEQAASNAFRSAFGR